MIPPQPASFVPLQSAGAAGGSNTEFKVKLVQQPGQVQSLQQFAQLATRPAAAPAAPGACEPRLTLQRDGDRVVAIHIQCSCGQVMELTCVY